MISIKFLKKTNKKLFSCKKKTTYSNFFCTFFSNKMTWYMLKQLKKIFYLLKLVFFSILQQNELNVYHIHHKYLQFYPNYLAYISMLVHNLYDYVLLMKQNQLNDLVFELHSKKKFFNLVFIEIFYTSFQIYSSA